MSEFIQQQTDQQVLILRINRPDKKNALTSDMYQALTNGLVHACEDDNVHCVLLTGGEDFTAGNDLADFLQNSGNIIDAPVGHFMQALLSFPKPIVAAVDGFAVGIGSTALLHCDFVYCTERTQFSLPFVNLGLVPELGSSQLLPLMVGHAKAAELLMLGEPFDANTAQQIGLANAVCEPDLLEQHALTIAHKLAAKPQQALQLTKALLKKESESLKKRVAFEANIFAECVQSPEAKSIMSAFINR